MALRLVTDLSGRTLPNHSTITVDHVETRFCISVAGMNEITEKSIKDLIQEKYKVVAIHTDSVLVRGRQAKG